MIANSKDYTFTLRYDCCMNIQRLLQHTFIFLYLILIGAAFFFTMTKREIPLIPWPLLRFHYGMMAPYQGYVLYNADLLAEGKLPDDRWEKIDLDPYYPMIKGNQILYRRMRRFSFDGEEIHKQKYTELAKLLRNREIQRGRVYESVKLTWQEWPRSPEGFAAMRVPPHIQNYFITQVP